MAHYLSAGTRVHVEKKGKALAHGVVMEHTDDSDEYIGNPEEWLTLRIDDSDDERLPVGTLKLRRPVSKIPASRYDPSGWCRTRNGHSILVNAGVYPESASS